MKLIVIRNMRSKLVVKDVVNLYIFCKKKIEGELVNGEEEGIKEERWGEIWVVERE